MKHKDNRFEVFDFVIILIFMGSMLGLFFYGRMNLILSIGLLAISIWMLLILAGRFAAPYYLEGRIVRFLMSKNGSVPLDRLKSYFSKYTNFDFLLNRLIDRNIIELAHETVLLKQENLKKGFKNKLMLWGTRKVKT